MKIKSLSIEHVIYSVTALMTLLAFLFPTETTHIITSVNDYVRQSLDWFILLLNNIFLLFMLYLAFGRYGNIVIGGKDAQKDFTNLSWFSMLFAAGLGVGLVLYGVSEPVIHTLSPPGGQEFFPANTPLAARHGMLSTFFNWGPHAWTLYAATSLAFAYFGYNRSTSMQTGNFIFDLIKLKNYTPVLILIDTIAYIAVLFGVIATLSLGVINLSEGLVRIFPSLSAADIVGFRIITLLSLAAVYTYSASTNIGKGIKNLSNINILIALFLLTFVLVTSDTSYIMRTFTTATGAFLNDFLKISTDLKHFSGNEAWVENWSIAYYLWWIAFCPFIGVFVARISRGRTFKEFILGTLIFPSLVIFLWFSVFGGAALHEIQIMGNLPLGETIVASQEKGIYELLNILPFSKITTIMAVILSFIFLVTSADSAAYVMGMMAGGQENPKRMSRIISSMILTFLTAYLIFAEYDNNFLRNITLIGATPYLIILILQAIAFFKALRRYE